MPGFNPEMPIADFESQAKALVAEQSSAMERIAGSEEQQTVTEIIRRGSEELEVSEG